MPLTKIKSLGITDGTITGDDINSTFNLTGKTVTLPAGVGGKVLQVLSATDSTERTTTSTSFVTGSNTLSVTITPANTSSKFFLCCSTQATADSQFALTLFRGATNLGHSTVGFVDNFPLDTTMTYLDSPNTSSAITYQFYMRTTNAVDAVKLRGNGRINALTVFEIAG